MHAYFFTFNNNFNDGISDCFKQHALGFKVVKLWSFVWQYSKTSQFIHWILFWHFNIVRLDIFFKSIHFIFLLAKVGKIIEQRKTDCSAATEKLCTRLMEDTEAGPQHLIWQHFSIHHNVFNNILYCHEIIWYRGVAMPKYYITKFVGGCKLILLVGWTICYDTLRCGKLFLFIMEKILRTRDCSKIMLSVFGGPNPPSLLFQWLSAIG